MKNNIKLVGPLKINQTPLDYLVSGSIASSIINGGINYQKFKNGDLTKTQAIQNTLKVSSQSGIAAGSAIATVGYLINKNYLGATLSLAVGIGSIVAIEKVYKTK